MARTDAIMTLRKLIDDKGRFTPGVIDHPVEEINYLDYDLRSVMDRPRSRLARRWRFNQFQFVSAMAPGWVFGMALVDLKLVANGFFYLYDFETGTKYERSFLQPLPAAAGSSPCLSTVSPASPRAMSRSGLAPPSVGVISVFRRPVASGLIWKSRTITIRSGWCARRVTMAGSSPVNLPACRWRAKFAGIIVSGGVIPIPGRQ